MLLTLVKWKIPMHACIKIKRSPNADTRTCDVTQVTKEGLLEASLQHIGDVGVALSFLAAKLTQAASVHDYDKLTAIDAFFADFQTGFEKTSWWDNHRRIHRHHLGHSDGVPADVNLLDVLEMVADCVMSGLARAGEVYPIELPDALLQTALANTTALLSSVTEVVD